MHTRSPNPILPWEVNFRPKEWTQDDAQALAQVEAEAAQLNRELAHFLVDANIREHGLTPTVETKLEEFLEALDSKRKAIDSLQVQKVCHAYHEKKLQHDRMMEQRREQQRLRKLVVDGQRAYKQMLDEERRRNARWRRVARWVRGRFGGKTKREDDEDELSRAKHAQGGGRPPSSTS